MMESKSVGAGSGGMYLKAQGKEFKASGLMQLTFNFEGEKNKTF